MRLLPAGGGTSFSEEAAAVRIVTSCRHENPHQAIVPEDPVPGTGAGCASLATGGGGRGLSEGGQSNIGHTRKHQRTRVSCIAWFMMCIVTSAVSGIHMLASPQQDTASKGARKKHIIYYTLTYIIV